MSSAFQHRHCFLLQGDHQQILLDFQKLSQHLKQPLICAHDDSDWRALSHEEQADPAYQFNTCCFKQAKQQLGLSHEAILIDLTAGLSIEAIAILAGTVRAGGLFALVLPEQDWLATPDQELARYLPWPLEPDQVHSYFKAYFWQQLEATDSPFIRFNDQQHSAIAPLPALLEDVELTQAQQQAQQIFLANPQGNNILLAPRGRGKSTLLGDCLAQLVNKGYKVALTAVHQQAISTLKQHYEHLKPNKDLPFYAADALLSQSEQWDYLLIDEAAMIPVPMLKALANQAQCTLFSTTDYGYEGAGKGFGLRFCEYLEAQEKPLKRLTLTTPIRWGENDPLENWLNQRLLLSPDPHVENTLSPEHPLCTDTPLQTSFTQLRNQQWLAQGSDLKDSFQLLLNAHYQTSPENLRWMLDDPSVQGFTLAKTSPQQNTSKLVSVAILTEEGPLPEQLSQAVLEGSRRPRGHLLPQSLLAHEGHKTAANYRYWRISRIATNPADQQQGYASQLLEHMETVAKQEGIDFLATSFAATLDTVKFWLKNGFQAVRLGTTKDQASGCYSLMMVKPLNARAQSQAQVWQQNYLANLMINLPKDYEGLEPSLAARLGLETLTPPQRAKLSGFTNKDKQDLELFAYHYRPYLTIRAQLARCVQHAINQQALKPSDQDCLLLATALKSPASKADFSDFGLHSRKQFEQRLKKIVQHLLAY
ncbi:GNAT family N-acetyltransferase [Marinomonas sp.]